MLPRPPYGKLNALRLTARVQRMLDGPQLRSAAQREARGRHRTDTAPLQCTHPIAPVAQPPHCQTLQPVPRRPRAATLHCPPPPCVRGHMRCMWRTGPQTHTRSAGAAVSARSEGPRHAIYARRGFWHPARGMSCTHANMMQRDESPMEVRPSSPSSSRRRWSALCGREAPPWTLPFGGRVEMCAQGGAWRCSESPAHTTADDRIAQSCPRVRPSAAWGSGMSGTPLGRSSVTGMAGGGCGGCGGRTFSIALSAMAPHAAVRTPLLPKSLQCCERRCWPQLRWRGW